MMKTVPTLCATATVVGASVVGLSFGRQNPLEPSHSNKRKPPPARELEPQSMPAATHTSATMTTTAPSISAPIPLPPTTSSSSRVPAASRHSQDGRPQRRILRRMTSGDAPPRPASAVVHGSVLSDHELDEIDTTTYVPTRRASWIKRLSTISNSQHSSRNPSPAPLSQSASISNGSMAFSHVSSTAPITGKQAATTPAPNRLVKRQPSLRRPATSHQRFATLQQQRALAEQPAEDPIIDDSVLSSTTDSEPEYNQFFTATVTKEKALTRRKGSLTQAKSFKRIVPDDKHKPTLVLAKSVVSVGAIEDEDSASEGESVCYVSRPGTPLSITAVITTKPAANPHENIPSRGRPSTDLADDASRPRRSFSITDLFSPGSSSRKRRSAAISPPRKGSMPLSAMGRRTSYTAHGDSTVSTARRNLTDPTHLRREIFTSSGPTRTGNSRHEVSDGPSSSPLPALQPHRSVAMAESTPVSMHQSDGRASGSTVANQIPPSPTLAQTGGRPSRHSAAPSEQASTLVGSDNEARGLASGDEDDADLQSETVFDSLRTGATRSTSGARGPRIETIFDESPPSKVKVTALRDLLPKGTFREQAPDGAPGQQQSIAEEEESISTPVRTIVPDRSIHSSPSFSRGATAPLFPNLIPSSPPDMPKPLSLGTLEWDSRAEDDDSSSRWSINEEDEEDPWDDLPRHPTHLDTTPVALGRYNQRLLVSTGSNLKLATPQHLLADHGDRDARSSIFDWSEQQPADKSSGNRTPPRPRTVHGKKDADGRGSRSVGRRAPSGLHARSQSVPVVPDAAGKRSTVVTNKFGTWGVGSKGVTEDWNDDFDFSDLNEEPAANGAANSHRIDSGVAMVVPKNIQEQQNNVLANIGLLREWGLLIEELKEQKIRAVTLGILDGPNSGMWEEVDAMIDLADQEAEHDSIPRLSPPSSPGFDEEAFDDVFGSSPNHGRVRRRSGLASEELGRIHTQSGGPKRKSILPPNHEIFGPQSSPIPSKPRFESPKPKSQPVVVTRPRKDSEAKARSVIEALQKRRSTHEPTADLPLTPASKKVPFDTATLRRIVPYVNTLTRKVKDAIRDAEGLYSSPSTSPRQEKPPFSKIFQQDTELTSQMKLMTVM